MVQLSAPTANNIMYRPMVGAYFSAECRKLTPQKSDTTDKLGSKHKLGYNETMTPESDDSASATDRSMQPCHGLSLQMN